MSQSLADILANRNFDEPPESVAIKQYVMRRFSMSVAVTVRPTDIVVTANSAAFAGALRMQTRQLQQTAGTDKRLVFRIA